MWGYWADVGKKELDMWKCGKKYNVGTCVDLIGRIYGNG